MLKGNTKRLRHGLRSRPELHPDTEREFQERVNAVLVDAGHAGSPPYVFYSEVRDFVRSELLVETAFAAVADEGASPKVIGQLVTLLTTKSRLAQLIGLERRLKPARSLEQYLREAEPTSSGDAGGAIATGDDG